MQAIKNIKLRNLTVLFLTLSITSCNKFLDVQPKSSISDENTIVDEKSAITAINGIYNALGQTGYYGIGLPMVGYTSGDNVNYIGTLVYNSQFTKHEVRSDNATVNDLWLAAYETINRANNAIDKIPKVNDASFTQTKKDQLVGQAYFIRGLAYFDIARIWGGAQIVLEPTKTVADKNGIKRSTTAETYTQALNDFKEAERLLPETTDRFRATKKTVWAIFSRYYLYLKDWEKAELYAGKLIDDQNNYQLVYPYSAWFENGVIGTKESIFEIAYSTSFLNTNRNDWQPAQNGGGRRIVPNDTYIALLNDPAVGGSRKSLISKTSTGLWYGNLYYRSPAIDPSYVIRIAEVYLNRAEARAKLQLREAALEDLNAIRHRADLQDFDSTDLDAVLLAIENERRIEFGLEPHRWFDLLRTGRAEHVLNIKDANKLVLPLPANETIIDKNLTQNPGY